MTGQSPSSFGLSLFQLLTALLFWSLEITFSPSPPLTEVTSSDRQAMKTVESTKLLQYFMLYIVGMNVYNVDYAYTVCLVKYTDY